VDSASLLWFINFRLADNPEVSSVIIRWPSLLARETVLSTLVRRLRRIDQWPETTATVVSSEVVSEGGYRAPPPSVRLDFYYRDSKGELQSGVVEADSFTSLYDLKENNTFTLRFNPRKPAKYYCSEADSFFTDLRFFFWLLIALFGMATSIVVL